MGFIFEDLILVFDYCTEKKIGICSVCRGRGVVVGVWGKTLCYLDQKESNWVLGESLFKKFTSHPYNYTFMSSSLQITQYFNFTLSFQYFNFIPSCIKCYDFKQKLLKTLMCSSLSIFTNFNFGNYILKHL
jgi:hypothetical protein